MTLSQKNAAGALLIKIIIIITESPTWWFNKHVSTHPQRTDQKRPREARRHHGQNTCDVTAAGIRQTGVGSRRPSGRYRVTTSTGELAFSVEFNYRRGHMTHPLVHVNSITGWLAGRKHAGVLAGRKAGLWYSSSSICSHWTFCRSIDLHRHQTDRHGSPLHDGRAAGQINALRYGKLRSVYRDTSRCPTEARRSYINHQSPIFGTVDTQLRPG